jgi:DNA polymerase
MTRVVLDLETCSVLALPAVGAAAYFEDKTTQVICACYAIDDGPIMTWCPGDVVPTFPADAIFVSHNYLFEANAWESLLHPRYGWPSSPPPERWSCTMARSLYHALPASLEGVCEALHLAVKKDPTARKLMLQLSRPRTTEPLTWWHQTDMEKFLAECDYCAQDVAAERLLDRVLPDLSPFEQLVFGVDGAINRRGLRIDRGLVTHMSRLVDAQMSTLDGYMASLTKDVTGKPRVRTCAQVGMLQTWLWGAENCHVPDLRKVTVAEALAAVPHASAKAKAALLTRQEAARASTKKLAAMVAGMSRDGRLRGLFQYGGAGRTLRWAGRRVQPQNFPRGTIKHILNALALIRQDVAPGDLSELFEDTALGVVASCLRSCFVADPDRAFAVGDLSQIEARIVAWLGGQQDVLDVFASGADVYTYTAAQQGSTSRQFGKVLILACGFGMGATRFWITAHDWGIDLSLEQAEAAVQAWRKANDRIVHFWWDIDDAAKALARGQDKDAAVWVRDIQLRRSKRALKIILPSGRALIYHHIGLEKSDKGNINLVFMGVDPKTKRWSKQRTYGGKLVENITQAMARDVMAQAMVELHDMGVPLVGTVHDELIAEPYARDADDTLAQMLSVMRTTPGWATGLPLAAEGWTGPRYRKA